MMEGIIAAIGVAVLFVALYFLGQFITYILRLINYTLNRWVWNGFRLAFCKIRKIEFKAEWPPIWARMFQLILIGTAISVLASVIGGLVGVPTEANVVAPVGGLIAIFGFLLEFASILAKLFPLLLAGLSPLSSKTEKHLGYKALARVPEFASTTDLIEALKSRSANMREATADILQKRGQSIVPDLIAASHRDDESVKSTVIEILDKIEPNWRAEKG